MARNKPIVASTGTHSGRTMRTKICRSFAPSILADSSISPGSCSMKVRTRIIRNTPIKPGKINTQNESINPSALMTIYVGIRPPPKYIVNTKKNEKYFQPSK
ncbi:hypothetical protein D3C81_1256680 [compost metagenome]